MAKEKSYYNNLGEFIDELKNNKELIEIEQEIDPYLEVTEISDRAIKSGMEALLFKNVKGSKIPLLMNMYGSKKRMELSLSVKNLNEIGDRIRELVKITPPKSFSQKLDLLPKLMELSKFPPQVVKKAPSQEVRYEGDNVNLDMLPIITCWPQDAGPFITLPMVITKDPDNDKQNVGMYRMQKYDSKSTGMHWHIHKGGAKHYRKYKAKGIKKMDVAVAIGCDPATLYSSSAPLPPEIDEFLFSGFLRKENVKLVKAIHSDLLVPAEAEIILEGYVDTEEELRMEGMFGDHTGFYSLADYYPVFHVTAITHRKNPVYPATIVGRPPMEDAYMGLATERIFLAVTQALLPEIVNFHLPPEGTFHNLIFVSIKKEYPGHAHKVMNALWGLGLMSLVKVIIVVDDIVNVENSYDAWWYTLANIDPQRDIIFSKGPTDVLDHASTEFAFHSKMGIDGTKKWKEEGFHRDWPDVIEMEKEIVKKVDSYWQKILEQSRKG